MSFSRKLLLAAFLTLLVITFTIQFCIAEENRTEVIAEINGVQLTRADLANLEDPQTVAEILDSGFNYYLTQRKALDVVIEQRLLSEEAKRQNLTVDQLLAKVSQGIVEPTEQELRIVYEFSGSKDSFEATREKITAQMRRLRQLKARSEFIEGLRAKATITVLLSPPVVEVALGDAPVRGSKNATVTLIEFADYECPYCQQTHPAIKRLVEEFGDKVAIAYKDFPLPNHPNARKAAEASRCAREQGKYWEYHDRLFETKKYTTEDLKQHARALNLDAPQFDQCLASGRHVAAIKSDFEQGRKLGISGTPSFFVNGRFFAGAVTYDMLREVLVQQLAAASAGSEPAKPRTAANASYQPDKTAQ
ncbi:MAG TPA: thioredoxin domain-containing protein [Terriglobales bacterium]|jgi:protein-disulfide isomerase|nr:thioredoxin domain-containing protein [Terriglobales bacterium]